MSRDREEPPRVPDEAPEDAGRVRPRHVDPHPPDVQPRPEPDADNLVPVKHEPGTL